MCLRKGDEDTVDITTYGDLAYREAVILCIRCGGLRYIYRNEEC